MEINTRAEGGWALHQSLQSQISIWRFDVYMKSVPYRDAFDGNMPVRVPAGSPTTSYLGSFYVSYLSQFAETIIAQHTQRQTKDAIPGFDKEKIAVLQKALDEAKRLLAKKECQKELAKAGIDIKKLTEKIEGLKIRPESDPNAIKYNVFDAERSSDPDLKAFLNTERGKSAGALFWGQNIFVRDGFFAARGSAAIGPVTSRALAFIHEAIHLTGKRDTGFGGSSKLNTLVIQACYSRLYRHNDLAIVGN